MRFVILFVIWSVGVDDLVLIKNSAKRPSFLPLMLLSVLFNKRASKALCWVQSHRDIQG